MDFSGNDRMHKIVPASLVLALAAPLAALADTSSDIQAMRREIETMRSDYEARLKALEERVKAAEAAAASAPAAAATAAVPVAAATAPAPVNPAAGNAFNPGISLMALLDLPSGAVVVCTLAACAGAAAMLRSGAIRSAKPGTAV
jgi:hypothetical protein